MHARGGLTVSVARNWKTNDESCASTEHCKPWKISFRERFFEDWLSLQRHHKSLYTIHHVLTRTIWTTTIVHVYVQTFCIQISINILYLKAKCTLHTACKWQWIKPPYPWRTSPKLPTCLCWDVHKHIRSFVFHMSILPRMLRHSSEKTIVVCCEVRRFSWSFTIWVSLPQSVPSDEGCQTWWKQATNLHHFYCHHGWPYLTSFIVVNITIIDVPNAITK